MPHTRSRGTPLADSIAEIDRVYHQRRRLLERRALEEIEDTDFSESLHNLFKEIDGMAEARPLKAWVQPTKDRMRGPAIVLSSAIDLEIKNHAFQ